MACPNILTVILMVWPVYPFVFTILYPMGDHPKERRNGRITMTNAKKRRDGHRSKTFEDLRGLRAEGYIRDSTLDQRDGFGPTIQRHNMERFAESYGMELGSRWYPEFVSGRRVQMRKEFQQFIDDAHLDAYDVLR